MPFDSERAEKRFGYGLSPQIAPAASVGAMLESVTGPDEGARDFPIPGYQELADLSLVQNRFTKYARENPDTPEAVAAQDKAQQMNGEVSERWAGWFGQSLLRRAHGRQSFRERLVAFWADHFTVSGSGALLRYGTSGFIEDAVRPHVGARFSDLLTACLTHPLMLNYLDQESSVGPNSIFAMRRAGKRGLNENLARETLELHTLGVGASYDQTDVRELAELFTGLSRGRDLRFKYNVNLAEPGAETVLGRTYGAERSMAPVLDVLHDLANHPGTARHIAWKLAVHFVADTPPPALVDDIREAFIASEGDLMAVYAAMLAHPEAWREESTNIRPPEEYISSAMRALAVPPGALAALDLRETRRIFFNALSRMGQPWQNAPGPDGWKEEDAAWVTPQGLAARLEWAFIAPARLLPSLPDPRVFVQQALGAEAPEKVMFAARAAESRADAVGLVLTSPAFMRR